MIELNSKNIESAAVAGFKALFKDARPFQYLVIDDVFSVALLRRVVHDFSAVKHNTSYDDTTTRLKFTCDDWTRFPPATFELVSYLNSGPFMSFVAEVTGIPNLTGDPYLLGGGMHETRSGGFLKMHTDFNFHKKLELDRRINAILFLNEGWLPSWGGELVLASPDMKEQISVAPVFNRMVIFNTNDFSFHGQPDPHTFPAGESRKSIAMYYYANGRPAEETTSAKIGTTYKARKTGDLPLMTRLKEAARLLAGSKNVK